MPGSVAGLAYFVPNPADQGYTEIYGLVVEFVTATSAPDGENATLFPAFGGKVAGLAYFVPKPADQGYAET